MDAIRPGDHRPQARNRGSVIRIQDVLRGSTDRTDIQLLRYTVVGGAAFLVDFGTLTLFTEVAGYHYLVSAALAFLLGLVTNYALSVQWVFPRHRLGSRWAEFSIFGLIGLVGLGLNEIIMWGLTEKVGFHYLASKMASTVIVYLWNFFVRKFALFNKEN
jgi:putative flippase GtrA